MRHRDNAQLVEFFNSLPNLYSTPSLPSMDMRDKMVPVIGEGNCPFRSLIQSMLLNGIIADNGPQEENVIKFLAWLYTAKNRQARVQYSTHDRNLAQHEFDMFLTEYKNIILGAGSVKDFFNNYFPLQLDKNSSAYIPPSKDKVIRFLAYCLRLDLPLPDNEKKDCVFAALNDDSIYRYLEAKGFNLSIFYVDLGLKVSGGQPNPNVDALLIPVASQSTGNHYFVPLSYSAIEPLLSKQPAPVLFSSQASSGVDHAKIAREALARAEKAAAETDAILKKLDLELKAISAKFAAIKARRFKAS